MKKSIRSILAAFFLGASVLSMAGCEKLNEEQTEITPAMAQTLMEKYLENKGFDGDDFLSECEKMTIDGEEVYYFSWRTKAGENADKLFGMYAVSLDGENYYEYHSAREEWIKDMNADWK